MEKDQVGRGHNRQFQMILASEIRVDHSYQRKLNDRDVKDIATNFNWDDFGVLYVSKRSDGSYWILDGQHRLAALRMLDLLDSLVPCYIYEGMTLGDEARRFAGLNMDRSPVRPIYGFNALVTGEQVEANAIEKVVDRVGFEVWNGRGKAGDGEISAVVALRTVYRAGGDAELEEVLAVIKAAWGDDHDGIQADVILGVQTFLRRYKDQVSKTRLLKALADCKPGALQSEGRAMYRARFCDMRTGVARAIVAEYNRKLKSQNRLPEFSGRDSSAGKTRGVK